jgi:hypothetical protein
MSLMMATVSRIILNMQILDVLIQGLYRLNDNKHCLAHNMTLQCIVYIIITEFQNCCQPHLLSKMPKLREQKA